MLSSVSLCCTPQRARRIRSRLLKLCMADGLVPLSGKTPFELHFLICVFWPSSIEMEGFSFRFLISSLILLQFLYESKTRAGPCTLTCGAAGPFADDVPFRAALNCECAGV